MLNLNPETPRIIVPLFARNLAELEAQAKAAQAAPEADLAELRLDPLREGDWLSALAMVPLLGRDADTVSLWSCVPIGVQLGLMVLSIVLTERALRRNFDKYGRPKPR